MFEPMRISVFCDTTKIQEKSIILKPFILHNNYAKDLLKN